MKRDPKRSHYDLTIASYNSFELPIANLVFSVLLTLEMQCQGGPKCDRLSISGEHTSALDRVGQAYQSNNFNRTLLIVLCDVIVGPVAVAALRCQDVNCYEH